MPGPADHLTVRISKQLLEILEILAGGNDSFFSGYVTACGCQDRFANREQFVPMTQYVCQGPCVNCRNLHPVLQNSRLA